MKVRTRPWAAGRSLRIRSLSPSSSRTRMCARAIASEGSMILNSSVFLCVVVLDIDTVLVPLT